MAYVKIGIRNAYFGGCLYSLNTGKHRSQPGHTVSPRTSKCRNTLWGGGGGCSPRTILKSVLRLLLSDSHCHIKSGILPNDDFCRYTRTCSIVAKGEARERRRPHHILDTNRLTHR